VLYPLSYEGTPKTLWHQGFPAEQESERRCADRFYRTSFSFKQTRRRLGCSPDQCDERADDHPRRTYVHEHVRDLGVVAVVMLNEVPDRDNGVKGAPEKSQWIAEIG
jgi:hypothetical protein